MYLCVRSYVCVCGGAEALYCLNLVLKYNERVGAYGVAVVYGSLESGEWRVSNILED